MTNCVLALGLEGEGTGYLTLVVRALVAALSSAVIRAQSPIDPELHWLSDRLDGAWRSSATGD